MLHLYHSNRMEILAAQLAARLGEPVDDGWAPETLVVASNGMRRWLCLDLADRLGICANLHFPLPSRLFWDIYRAVLPGVPTESAFATPILAWRVLAEFGGLDDDPVWEPLRDYLAGSDDYGRYELARRIADTFDQYLVYRPKWIKNWEKGGAAPGGKGREEDEDDEDGDDCEGGWQAALWRRLSEVDATHRARLHRQFLKALKQLHERPAGIPARLSFIGIPALPAAWLQTLLGLARWCEVDLYLLNPCAQFWGMIESERTIAKIAPEADHAALYLETGNRLLASMGRLGRDFHHLLADSTSDLPAAEAFEEPEADTLLAVVQRDLLRLENRGANHAPSEHDGFTLWAEPYLAAADDHSIQMHVCHSATREIEVLHERLLALFAADDSLAPTDVVVMTPDIEAYAPAVEAVFGAAESGLFIPYGIADRGVRAESPLLDAFLALLELPGGRWGAETVASLLDAAALRRRFGILEEDLGTLRDWLTATGVRWGLDADHRQSLELPAESAHTWRAGLDRLLLGIALPGDGERLYAGVLPYDEVEGHTAQLAGRLAQFVDRLAALESGLAAARAPAGWSGTLAAVFEDFLAPEPDDEAEAARLRTAIQRLAETAAIAGFGGAVPLAVARRFLLAELEGMGSVQGFLAGGVTFCAMVPMRAIPFRVVCLIGMNDGAYPRVNRPHDFDLIARHPRRGDRSRRNDDRYLFLEALVSARDVFYVSWTGRSQRDNAELPPSVLVAELLDYIARAAQDPRDGAAEAGQPQADALEALRRVCVEHPLTPWGTAAFDGGDRRRASHSPRWCRAAQLAGRGERMRREPCPEPLPDPETEWLTLSPERLTDFLCAPARFLLRERLRLRLDEAEGELAETEPFLLDDFADRRLRGELLRLRQRGLDPDAARRVLAGSGLLPHGAVGRLLYAREAAAVETVLARLPAGGDTVLLEPLPVDLTLAGVRLLGWLREVGGHGILVAEPNPPGWRERLRLWVRHLLLCRAVQAGLRMPDGTEVPARSLCHGPDAGFAFAPVANPDAVLEPLLALYRSGLLRPSAFIPPVAWAWWQGKPDDTPERAIAQALKKWEGDDFTGSHACADDRWNRCAYDGVLPAADAWQTVARGVFAVMTGHETTIGDSAPDTGIRS